MSLGRLVDPLIASAIVFVFSAHAFIWGTTSITVLQRAVPSQLQGRVGSVNVIATYGGLVVGSAASWRRTSA